MPSQNGHCGVVRMLLEAKANVHSVCVLSPLCMSGLSSGKCTISWSSFCMS